MLSSSWFDWSRLLDGLELVLLLYGLTSHLFSVSREQLLYDHLHRLKVVNQTVWLKEVVYLVCQLVKALLTQLSGASDGLRLL